MKTFYSTALIILSICFTNAQNDITDSYDTHFSKPREVAFVHLNKTEFFKGELIGFKAYVFDKASKTLSKNTRNLYCVIENNNKEIVLSDLVLVKNGVASSTFNIDSTIAEGNYTFKAYTNWMRNFEEPNYFSTPIKINAFNQTRNTKASITTVKPDIQVLPEGGHLIADIKNNLGIIAKSQFGNGLKNAKGYLLNNTNDTINTFTLNKFGIAKTVIIPKKQISYKVIIKQGNTFYTSKVPEAKPIGLNIMVNSFNNQVYIKIATNTNSLKTIKQNTFTCAIHNGDNITTHNFNFTNNLDTTIKVPLNTLTPGINIVTIFDENNKPLLERLFFNYNGVNTTKTNIVTTTKKFDSLELTLNIPNLKKIENSTLSVSVLHNETLAYKPNHNILSQIYLKPYLKGKIENAQYYFNKNTNVVKYNLDILLLTQGWSSYNWNTIFTKTDAILYPFEQGISFNATVNNRKANNFLVEPLSNSKSKLINLPEDDNNFIGKGLYPINDEKFVVTGFNDKGKTSKPGLFVTFSPNKIPKLITTDPEVYVNSTKTSFEETQVNFETITGVNQLDEVVIEAKKKEDKIRKIQRQFMNSDVYLVDNQLRDSNVTFANWLSSKGYIVIEDVTQRPMLQITRNRRGSFSASAKPIVFFNGVPLRDGNINLLFQFSMANIEYVTIDDLGISAPFGAGGGGGVIRVKTNNKIYGNDKTFNDVFIKPFDLTFANQKKYYTPKYKNYANSFFKNYGVIHWEPNVNINRNGIATIKIPNTNSKSIKLFIEGVTPQQFISEIKTVEIN